MTARRRSSRSHYTDAGFKPGSLPTLAATNPLASPKSMRVIGYDRNKVEEITIERPEDIAAFQQRWPTVWIDVEGLGNSELIVKLGELFSIHTLTLEDIFDARHQPKIEEYNNYLFVLLKQGTCVEDLDLEQVSLLIFEHVVITIREHSGESFSQVRERLRQGSGRLREGGADFLGCALIDATVEGYYPILRTLRERLDSIEDSFLENSTANLIRRIHDVKRDLLLLHSAVWPVQEIMMVFGKHGEPLVHPETAHYIRDCQDQAKQVKDLAEFYRLLASDLMNTTLAFSDNKANEVMKVLTMVATIFIPLSFIASLYGMNFDYSVSHYNMPELHTRYGYPAVLSGMLTITGCLLWMFKRKGWFNKDK